ncbi:MAG: hypothetical protein WD851_24915 [Pirellulales bacterium]
MIYFVTTSGHPYTIERHLEAWGRELIGRLQPISYRQLLGTSRHPRGVYLLTDIERLGPRATDRAAALYRRLRGEGSIVLNDPAQVRRRADLLQTLHSAGVNRFRVFNSTDALEDVRYPVFLRCADDHRGNRSSLLTGPGELHAAIAEQGRTRWLFRDEHDKFRFFRWGPRRRRELLITEFCNTADSTGMYRKYSAFALAGRIVPRHVFFGTHWMLKAPELLSPEAIQEERRYLARNPHAVELREIFALARIDYGRIDYGICDGQIQVWEINTNPMITHRSDARIAARVPVQEDFSRRLSGVFRELEQMLLVQRYAGQRRRAA